MTIYSSMPCGGTCGTTCGMTHLEDALSAACFIVIVYLVHQAHLCTHQPTMWVRVFKGLEIVYLYPNLPKPLTHTRAGIVTLAIHYQSSVI